MTRQFLSRVGAVALTAGILATSGAACGESGVAASAFAGTQTAPRQTQEISLADAVKAAQAAIADCEKDGNRVTVVVLTRAGVVKVALQADDAGPQTFESAKAKAFTAVSMGRKTSELAGSAGGDAPSIRDLPGTLFLGGGVPVAAGNLPIAGIGVGGAPSGDIDERCASAGSAAIQ